MADVDWDSLGARVDNKKEVDWDTLGSRVDKPSDDSSPSFVQRLKNAYTGMSNASDADVNALKSGASGALRGLGATAKAVGWDKGADYLNSGADYVAPPSTYSVPKFDIRDPSTYRNIEENLASGLPRFGLDAAAGAVAGPAGFIGADAAQTFGQNVANRMNKNGGASPTTQDYIAAGANSLGQGVLGRFGVGQVIKPGLASSVIGAGAAGAGTAAVDQVGSSLGTNAGLNVDPTDIANTAVLSAAGGAIGHPIAKGAKQFAGIDDAVSNHNAKTFETLNSDPYAASNAANALSIHGTPENARTSLSNAIDDIRDFNNSNFSNKQLAPKVQTTIDRLIKGQTADDRISSLEKYVTDDVSAQIMDHMKAMNALNKAQQLSGSDVPAKGSASTTTDTSFPLQILSHAATHKIGSLVGAGVGSVLGAPLAGPVGSAVGAAVGAGIPMAAKGIGSLIPKRAPASPLDAFVKEFQNRQDGQPTQANTRPVDPNAGPASYGPRPDLTQGSPYNPAFDPSTFGKSDSRVLYDPATDPTVAKPVEAPAPKPVEAVPQAPSAPVIPPEVLAAANARMALKDNPAPKVGPEPVVPDAPPPVSESQRSAAPDDGRTDSLSRTASWVIKEKATGKPVMETFDPKKVDALNTAKYEAVPILEHLQGLNKAIKNGDVPPEVTARAEAQLAAKEAKDTDTKPADGSLMSKNWNAAKKDVAKGVVEHHGLSWEIPSDVTNPTRWAAGLHAKQNFIIDQFRKARDRFKLEPETLEVMKDGETAMRQARNREDAETARDQMIDEAHPNDRDILKRHFGGEKFMQTWKKPTSGKL